MAVALLLTGPVLVMIAVGCLALIVLPLLGAVVGGYAAGPVGARWGALAGLTVAMSLSLLSVVTLIKISRRR